MTLKELESRLLALEQSVALLRAKVEKDSDPRSWWEKTAGIFANDPVYDEIVRRGKEYRESLHPDRKKKKKMAKRADR